MSNEEHPEVFHEVYGHYDGMLSVSFQAHAASFQNGDVRKNACRDIDFLVAINLAQHVPMNW